MGWLAFLIVGLLAGIIGKAIMPGSKDEPAGWIMTIVLGIAGAFVGGYIGAALNIGGGFFTQVFLAAVGAALIIGVMRLFDGSRRAV